MAMIGDLQAFALPDLLRTLGNARQSGQLSVWSREGVYRIWLNQGAVSAAIAPHPESSLQRLCVDVMDPSVGALLEPLRPTKTPLLEPLGNWLRQQDWLTEEKQALVFQLQLHAGLYPLFELAVGQFYFVGDMVPLPYWDMTGLELNTLEAIAQGLNTVNSKAPAELLPSLDTQFVTVTAAPPTLRLSLVDKRLLQWFGQPNTIQSLCQVLKVEPLELQKACKRLLHLRLIKAVTPDALFADLEPVDSSAPPETVLSEDSQSLIKRIAAVLNTPLVGKAK
jgi:hypothetical protein